MKLRDKLKNIDFLRKMVKNYKIKKEFKRDANDFCNYYIEADNISNQAEYQMLLYIHSLEKGMSSKNLRPFGKQKVLDLIKYIKIYESIKKDSCTAYKMAISILRKWTEMYDEHNWEKDSIYNVVLDFLNLRKDVELIEVGVKEVKKSQFIQYNDFNYIEAIKSRHSIREFQNCELSVDLIKRCVESANFAPSACNRQMCKAYYVKNKKHKKYLDEKIVGIGGFDKNTVNYIVISYDISAFSFYGERNQGFFNAGLFAMNLANALHFNGIGSCFLQWSNDGRDDRNTREVLAIPKNERIVVVLAVGYYPDQTIVPVSQRKEVNEIFKIV